MWDEITLRYLNEQAYHRSLKMVNEGLSSTATMLSSERVFPLAILSYKLITGPPSLTRLIDVLEDSDSMASFLELVRDYLPAHEGEIMARVEDSDRIQRFCHYFNNQYFPLSDVPQEWEDYTISDFVHHIPVDLMGFTMEDYEEYNSFRSGFILLLAMAESPYESPDPALYGGGQRVPLLESVKELVGRDLMERIPPDGWSLDDLHSMLDGTEYEGCAAFADWINQNTGCWQLDANYQEYEPEYWSQQMIAGLTEQWPRVLELTEKMDKMYEWLEEDVHHNFRKLLSFMLGLEDESVAREQIPFPLDNDAQVIREEVIENGR